MKVALITGGSRGIGRAMVEEFAAVGFAVAFTYAASTEAAQAVVAQVADRGGKAIALLADVKDFSRAQAVVEEVRRDLGNIDVLVNNAGIRRDRALSNMAWKCGRRSSTPISAAPLTMRAPALGK